MASTKVAASINTTMWLLRTALPLVLLLVFSVCSCSGQQTVSSTKSTTSLRGGKTKLNDAAADYALLHEVTTEASRPSLQEDQTIKTKTTELKDAAVDYASLKEMKNGALDTTSIEEDKKVKTAKLSDVVADYALLHEGKNEPSAPSREEDQRIETETIHEADLDSTLQHEAEEMNFHRRLPAGFFEGFNRLFQTPVKDWTGGQWLLFLVMLFLVLWCCGCLSINCRRRHQRYYRGTDGRYYRDDRYYRRGGTTKSSMRVPLDGRGDHRGFGESFCEIFLCERCFDSCCMTSDEMRQRRRRRFFN